MSFYCVSPWDTVAAFFVGRLFSFPPFRACAYLRAKDYFSSEMRWTAWRSTAQHSTEKQSRQNPNANSRESLPETPPRHRREARLCSADQQEKKINRKSKTFLTASREGSECRLDRSSMSSKAQSKRDAISGPKETILSCRSNLSRLAASCRDCLAPSAPLAFLSPFASILSFPPCSRLCHSSALGLSPRTSPILSELPTPAPVSCCPFRLPAHRYFR